MRVYQDTSREAYEKVRPSLPARQAQVLEVFQQCGPSTADEVALFLNLHVLSVRPTVTMLKKKGLIQKTQLRRNTSVLGNSSIVWEAV